jgi:hypothetical protein
MARVQASAALVAVVLVLAGCSGQPAGLGSNGAEHAGHVLPVGPVTSLPTAGQLSSACNQPATDGGQARLRSVQLVVQDEQLVLAFALQERVPANLRLDLVAAPGRPSAATKPTVAVTTVVTQGRPTAVEITTPNGSVGAQKPSDLVHLADREVHVGLPSSVLTSLGKQWHWSATAVSGKARGACPAADVVLVDAS